MIHFVNLGLFHRGEVKVRAVCISEISLRAVNVVDFNRSSFYGAVAIDCSMPFKDIDNDWLVHFVYYGTLETNLVEGVSVLLNHVFAGFRVVFINSF